MSNETLTASHSLSESRWIESESIRLLMQPRSSMMAIAVLAMFVMAGLLYGYVNTALVLGWLALSLLVVVARMRVKAYFAKHLAQADIDAQVKFVDRYGPAWTLNALTWGLSGWLFFANIPIQYQYICVCILNIVGFVAIHNLTPHRKIVRQFINFLIGTQVVGALWKIGIVHHFQSPQIQYIHLISLLVFWILFRVLDNRFYSSFHSDHVLQYRNANLIDFLNRQTKQLAHEKQLALNANETIKRFYSSAAHDIRQPVYALRVYSDFVAEDPTQAHHLIPKISQSCDAIHALFDSLLDFEKVHSGQINVAYEAVDMADVFHELELHFRPFALAKNLEMRVVPVTGFLYTDYALVKRILSHFVSNAIKYTNKGGLLIGARKTEKFISFEVWDTGIGIDSAHHDDVFEEFFKVGEQSSADEGFGLGLSIVKRLATFVEGASIIVQSKLGRGTVFKFKVLLSLYAPLDFSATLNTSMQLERPLDIIL